MKIVTQNKDYAHQSAGVGNTRLDSQAGSKALPEPSLDWLDFRGRVPDEAVLDIITHCERYTDDVVDWSSNRSGGRHIHLEQVVTTVRGAQYGFTSNGEGMSEIWVSIPGKALGGCDGLMGKLHLAQRCKSYGLRCTRLDLNLDDWSGYLSQVRKDMLAAYQDGSGVGFKKVVVMDSWDEPGKPETTAYFGSRESASFVRVYDKGDIVRWERQMRRDIADVVLEVLVARHVELKMDIQYDEKMGAAVVEHLTNGIDFVKRKDKNLERATRLDFWQDFLTWLGETQLKVTRQPQQFLLQKTLGWLDRQCGRVLALARDIAGMHYQEWMGNLLARGRKRYQEKHHKLVKLLQGERFWGLTA